VLCSLFWEGSFEGGIFEFEKGRAASSIPKKEPSRAVREGKQQRRREYILPTTTVEFRFNPPRIFGARRWDFELLVSECMPSLQ
jgi:hypothetical protein